MLVLLSFHAGKSLLLRPAFLVMHVPYADPLRPAKSSNICARAAPGSAGTLQQALLALKQKPRCLSESAPFTPLVLLLHAETELAAERHDRVLLSEGFSSGN